MNEHEKELNTAGQHSPDPKKQSRKDDFAYIREISYAVLFFGAVFIVSAMETGSYRTPWPVAIITALAGIVLFGYSRSLKKKDQK